MNIKSWGFADGSGHELGRGWQGYEDQARARAQQLADDHGEPISFWPEGQPELSEDVEPIGVVETRAHRAEKALKQASD